MDLLKRKDKPMTPEEQATLTSNTDIRTHEALADVDYSKLVQLKEFGAMLLEDGSFQTYFSPRVYVEKDDGNMVAIDNPLYSVAYEPLRLFFSRLLRLGNMTESDKIVFRGQVHLAAQRCYTMTKKRAEHFIIKSMEDFLGDVVCSQASGGFFLRTLYENTKTLKLLNPAMEKKKGWFGF